MADEIVEPETPEVKSETPEKPETPEAKPAEPAPTNAERAAAKAAKEAENAKEGKEDEPETPETPETSDDEDEDKDLDTSVWGDAGGDEVAQSVMQTLQNSGVSTVDAKAMLWDAVEAGDPSKVDRDALVEKVGKAKATLIMAGIENVTSRNNEQIKQVTETVSTVAGSKENWDKAAKWAVASMSAEQVDELRGMIDQGGAKARFAAGEIVKAYNNDPKNTALSAGTKQLTPEGKSTAKVKGLSRREYGDAIMKLERKGGTEQEFAALRAQRKAGKAAGI